MKSIWPCRYSMMSMRTFCSGSCSNFIIYLIVWASCFWIISFCSGLCWYSSWSGFTFYYTFATLCKFLSHIGKSRCDCRQWKQSQCGYQSFPKFSNSGNESGLVCSLLIIGCYDKNYEWTLLDWEAFSIDSLNPVFNLKCFCNWN